MGDNLLPSTLHYATAAATCMYNLTSEVTQLIKALTSLVGRLSLSVGWENGPDRECKIDSFNFLSFL